MTAMASFNKVILVGNLTRDPQVRYTTGGTAVAEIGLAVSRQWFDKQSNQKREETTFVDITLWGRQAEVAGEYLAKGRPVLIEGRLQLDTWDDKDTGQKRSKLRVVAENMTMLGSRSDGGGGDRNNRRPKPETINPNKITTPDRPVPPRMKFRSNWQILKSRSSDRTAHCREGL
jgi:single-strand DNA-binding protein